MLESVAMVATLSEILLIRLSKSVNEFLLFYLSSSFFIFLFVSCSDLSVYWFVVCSPNLRCDVQ